MGLYGPIWAYMGLYGPLRASMDVSAGRSVQAETNIVSFVRGKNTGSSTRKLLERGRKEITCPEPRTRASREFLQLRLSNVQLTAQETIDNDTLKCTDGLTIHTLDAFLFWCPPSPGKASSSQGLGRRTWRTRSQEAWPPIRRAVTKKLGPHYPVV